MLDFIVSGHAAGQTVLLLLIGALPVVATPTLAGRAGREAILWFLFTYAVEIMAFILLIVSRDVRLYLMMVSIDWAAMVIAFFTFAWWGE